MQNREWEHIAFLLCERLHVPLTEVESLPMRVVYSFLRYDDHHKSCNALYSLLDIHMSKLIGAIGGTPPIDHLQSIDDTTRRKLKLDAALREFK